MMDKKKNYLWVIIVAVIAVVAVVGTVLFMRPSNDNAAVDQAAPETSSAPTSSAAPHGADGQWINPSTDLVGRGVKVPANGVGNPIGSADQHDHTVCEPSASEITIEKTHDTYTMWTQNQGPSRVTESSIPVGYARTSEAAMIAGWNSTSLIYRGGETSGPAVKETVSGPDVDQLAQELMDSPPAKDENSKYLLVPSAYRITDCSDEQVVGEVAVPLVADDEGNPTTSLWTVFRFSVIWENNDWKNQLGQVDPPLKDKVTDLSGWTRWS